MSRERDDETISPVNYASSSNSQIAEGVGQNAHSSRSNSPVLATELSSFGIVNNVVRELSSEGPSYGNSTNMDLYMDYLARQASIGDNAAVAIIGATTESLSLLTNTTNSLSFGVITSVSDDNGGHTVDGTTHLNESENNNNMGSDAARASDLDNLESSRTSRNAFLTSDPGSRDGRREIEQRESPVLIPSLPNVSDTPPGRNFGATHLAQPDFISSKEIKSTGEGNNTHQNPTHNNKIPSSNSRPQPLKLSSATRLKITVLNWNVAASWKWTAGDETCGICRMPFEACCIECRTPGDECPLALGACKHAFHMHCIMKWTETQNSARPQCPLCRQEWKFAPG